jgi:iron-sulfur cluster insertion protein
MEHKKIVIASVPFIDTTAPMITITEQARSKIADILAEENNPKLKVRAFVQGGGCSGFQYGFTLDEDQNEDDFDVDGVLVDSMSMQYLTGATIDYKEDQYGSAFSIKNPNAQTTCGCGSSFSV